MQSDPPMSPNTPHNNGLAPPTHNVVVPIARADLASAARPPATTDAAAPPSPVGAGDNPDARLHAMMARLTGGISPISLAVAQVDWALNLFASPAKLQQLMHSAAGNQLRLTAQAMRSLSRQAVTVPTAPQEHERRADHPAWRTWPYSLFQQSFQLNRSWWQNATTGVTGVAPQHERVVQLLTQQLLDLMAPANHTATNPELLDATLREGGQNLVRGTINLLNDLENQVQLLPPPGAELFKPGKQVALTRGKVVLQHPLFELLQYHALTDDVQSTPVLFVPGWDQKYYVLDLSRTNSLAHHVVSQKHTVFMLSWINPPATDTSLTFESYLDAVFAATGAVRTIVPGPAVNAAGHGLGATLLAMAAASKADAIPFNSVTLLSPRTDFSVAGELAYRAGGSAARLLNEYLLGQRDDITDVAAWRADRPRQPVGMHGAPLRGRFPDGDLSTGRFQIAGQTLALHRLKVPLFLLAAEHEDRAAWQGPYQLAGALDTDLTFLLTEGDNDSGLLGAPERTGHHYRCSHSVPGARYVEPPRWYEGTAPEAGSWWPVWLAWLARHNPPGLVAAPQMGAPQQGYPALAPAPGSYVLQR